MENTTLLLVGTMVACTTGALMVILRESGQYVGNPKANTNPITSVQAAVIEYQDGLKNIPNPWVFPTEQSYTKKIENASNSLTTYSQFTASRLSLSGLSEQNAWQPQRKFRESR